MDFTIIIDTTGRPVSGQASTAARHAWVAAHIMASRTRTKGR